MRCGELALLLALLPTLGWANDFETRRQAAVDHCRSIDPDETVGGLLFNPDGYRSYYVRSACLLEAAVDYRDPGLCAEVKQRKFTLLSSWAVSSDECIRRVAEAISDDVARIAELRRNYEASPIQPTSFDVFLNGNRRAYDIWPLFEGADRGRHELLITASSNGTAVVIHESTPHIDATSRLVLHIPKSDLGSIDLDREQELTITLKRVIQDSTWSDPFIEEHFPEDTRRHTATQSVVFNATQFRSIDQ